MSRFRTHLTGSLMPTWWIFTLPNEFLPHQENFTPSLKMSETR